VSPKEQAEAIVSLWVNNRRDRGARLVGNRLLGRDIPRECTDLVNRIAEALEAREPIS
jgi:hypothetical protein